MATKEDIRDGILQLSVLDVAWLVKELEDKFGVSAAVPMAVAAAPAATAANAAEGAASSEEKTDFNVLLKEVGENKINVIKAVREVTSLGLKEAKDMVEAAPTAIKEAISKEEASSIKSKLEEAGATVTIE